MIGLPMGAGIALRWAAALALPVLLWFGWQAVTDHYIERGVLQEQARSREANAEAYRESVRLGSQMAATAREEARAEREFAGGLQQELKRRDRPALVRTTACGGPRLLDEPGADGAAAGAAHPDAEPGGPGLAAIHTRLPGDLQPDAVRLTAAAVSLWDSALAGTVVPAGACRADDTAAAGCAVATGITVDDAVDNHIVNASRCRQDRVHHQALIDYLRARDQVMQRQESNP